MSTTTTAGDAWDAFGGAPDPFVEVRVGFSAATPSTSGAGSDTFAVNFTGGPTASDVRADALQTYLGFVVRDEDATSHDFIGACFYDGLPDAAFAELSQTTECPRDVATMNAGFTLTWHLERF